MKKICIVFLIFTLFTVLFAYSVNSNNPDYYYVNNFFSPDEVWAKDSTTGFWHDFFFPPNISTHWDTIVFAKKHGLGVSIDYRLNNNGERIIYGVSTF